MFLAGDSIHTIKERLPDAQVFHWSVISGVEMGTGTREQILNLLLYSTVAFSSP